jgi:excisionase family DNA binding protein
MAAVLDSDEAAAYLRITSHTLRRLARHARIPCFKVGGQWRFRQADLDHWAGAQQEAHKPARVLLVDDEARIRNCVRLMLEADGHHVEEAADGADALACMRRRPADLVLLDLVMPGMNGQETLKAIRTDWPQVPVVILTAYPESDVMEQALLYSPLTLLSKPATGDQIRACVRHHGLRAPTLSR